MPSHGQGLSMSTLVVASIVILILVILSLLVTRSLRLTGEETSRCQDRGGTCLETCPEEQAHYGPGDTECEQTNDYKEQCCIPVTDDE